MSEGVTIAGWGATGFRQPTSDKLLQGLIRWPEQSLILLDIHRIVPSVSSQRRIVRKSFLPSETVKYYCQFFVLCKHFLTMRKGNLVKQWEIQINIFFQLTLGRQNSAHWTKIIGLTPARFCRLTKSYPGKSFHSSFDQICPGWQWGSLGYLEKRHQRGSQM